MKLLITKLIKTGKETNMYDSTWGSCFKHIVYSGSKVVCFPNIKRLRLRTMAEKPLMKITSVYKFTRYILRLRMETQPSDYMTNNAQHKQEQHTLSRWKMTQQLMHILPSSATVGFALSSLFGVKIIALRCIENSRT